MRDAEEGMALPLRSSEETRREFLARVGLGACALTAVGAALTMLDFMEPKVLFEPPTQFKAGHLQDFPEGTIKFDEEHRAYIVGGQGGVFAVSAVCTHLGCTVKYFRLNQPETVEVNGEKKSYDFEFHCPCHGSMYYGDGTNFSGPAPRPLHWYKMEVSPDDGQLLVDLGTEVEQNFRLTV